jgi:hypothetical protein
MTSRFLIETRHPVRCSAAGRPAFLAAATTGRGARGESRVGKLCTEKTKDEHQVLCLMSNAQAPLSSKMASLKSVS